MTCRVPKSRFRDWHVGLLVLLLMVAALAVARLKGGLRFRATRDSIRTPHERFRYHGRRRSRGGGSCDGSELRRDGVRPRGLMMLLVMVGGHMRGGCSCRIIRMSRRGVSVGRRGSSTRFMMVMMMMMSV